ncbi:probable nicotinate-nucleotide adenylyltransferase [Leptospira ryugenii]|uniref:Probable nicotinate-nucleotide adenylyltransferase n=1 Tax=Leptospira ryugenii TaxID=1917863 RepID=A0A2P2DX03_9LEPT|nr:nicotinate-nicotinamide nucleotide adenylyltransferase [Leptospira ryugenii]GBF49168.1 probable nicotinate-nucleotide adenylyltransferase [Leptospira ryugenii]
MAKQEYDHLIFFGGSFDPPHLAHLEMVRILKKDYLSKTKILIVPNYQSPFKDQKSLLREDILLLCKWNFASILDENTELSSLEISKKEKSYTVETLEELKSNYSQTKISLCMGEDSILTLPTWFQYDRINQLVSSYLIFRRHTPSPVEIKFPNNSIRNKSKVYDNPLWDISSTMIRNKRKLSLAKIHLEEKVLGRLVEIGWFSEDNE